MSTIYGNMVGGASMAQTYILQDPEGNEVTAVLAEEPVKLNAGVNDIREGRVAATENGVTVGEKVIPSYHTSEGFIVTTNGREVVIPNLNKDYDGYDYTKLQVIICEFNTNMSNSVAADKISIYDNVYDVQSTDPISAVTKDHALKEIHLGITNNSGKPWIVRYIMYKEIE